MNVKLMLMDSAKMADTEDTISGDEKKLESKEDIINYLNGML